MNAPESREWTAWELVCLHEAAHVLPYEFSIAGEELREFLADAAPVAAGAGV